jgi:hypothetical protein
MKAVRDVAGGELRLKERTGDTAAEADEELGAWSGVRDVPHLGLRFAVELDCQMVRGVDLKGQPVSGVEDLAQEREPPIQCGSCPAKQLRPMMLHEPAKALPGEASIDDDALVAGPIAHLPRLADLSERRESLAIERLEHAATPGPFLEEGFEDERVEHDPRREEDSHQYTRGLGRLGTLQNPIPSPKPRAPSPDLIICRQ